MSLSIQPYKGARDFYPMEKRVQKYMFSVMRKVVESFGYQEYDTPILEPTELYLSKGNAEIINEQTYTFTDRGERSVTIRTEMTPSVSRLVAAKRQEHSYPLRWYSIPNCWRYERPQRGRMREFWQLNVDIFGVAGVEADHEIILVADAILQSYGAKREMYEVRLNSRKLINFIMHNYLGLEETQVTTLIRLIDRIHKMPEAEFIAMVEATLHASQREDGLLLKITQLLKAKQLFELPKEVLEHESLAEISTLMQLLKASGVTNAVFDITLMRGFDYYTDIVFEVFDTHPENNRSMFGGGRYDGLVAQFGVEAVPTVGFGMGDITLLNFLLIHKLLPSLPQETDAVALLIGGVYEKSLAVLDHMRREGVRIAVDSSGRKFDKQLKNAIKSGVKYAVIIGEDELASGQLKLKDLASGNEESHSVERVISIIAASHKPVEEDLYIGLCSHYKM